MYKLGFGFIVGLATGALLFFMFWQPPEMDSSAASSFETLTPHSAVNTSAKQPNAIDGGKQTSSNLFDKTLAYYQGVADLTEDEVKLQLQNLALELSSADTALLKQVLLTRLAGINPQAALDYIVVENPANIHAWLQFIFQVWAKDDINAALVYGQFLPPAHKTTALRAIYTARPELSQQQRQEFATQVGAPHYASEWEQQLQLATIQRDPAAAWADATQIPGYSLRREALMNAAFYWGQQDPTAALAALVSVEDRALRLQLQRRIIDEWSKQQAHEAIDWLISQPQSTEKTELLTRTLTELAQSDPAGAIQYSREYLDQRQGETIEKILAVWAKNDIQSAAQWFKEANPADLNGYMASTIATQYAKQTPVEALAWATQLPETLAKNAVSAAVKELVHTNPDYANQLIQHINNPSVRDSAVESQVAALTNTNLRAAIEIVQTTDNDRQAYLYQVLYRNWARFDLAAAINYLDNIQNSTNRDNAIYSIFVNLDRNMPATTAKDLLSRMSPNSSLYPSAEMYANYALRDR